MDLEEHLDVRGTGIHKAQVKLRYCANCSHMKYNGNSLTYEMLGKRLPANDPSLASSLVLRLKVCHLVSWLTTFLHLGLNAAHFFNVAVKVIWLE